MNEIRDLSKFKFGSESQIVESCNDQCDEFSHIRVPDAVQNDRLRIARIPGIAGVPSTEKKKEPPKGKE